MATAAAIDRLVHHATILEFNVLATEPESPGGPTLARPSRLPMRRPVDPIKATMMERVSNADRAQGTRCAHLLTRANQQTIYDLTSKKDDPIKRGAKSEYRCGRPRCYRTE